MGKEGKWERKISKIIKAENDGGFKTHAEWVLFMSRGEKAARVRRGSRGKQGLHSRALNKNETYFTARPAHVCAGASLPESWDR